MIRLGTILGILFAVVWPSVRADPCRTNFGDCDSTNGLCWGTARYTHFCSCKAGYKDSGLAAHFCIDVDECQEDRTLCPENAVCQNTDGSYTCTCLCGYVMDYTGQRCLDASQIDGMCQVPKSCTHKDGSGQTRPFDIEHTDFVSDFTELQTLAKKVVSKEDRDGCKCTTGFEFNKCGYCVDIDECVTGNPCPGLQSTCTNTEGSYYCGCNPGYVLGPCGIRCYLPRQEIPQICPDEDMQELKVEGVKFRTFTRPKRLKNWRKCPRGLKEKATITEKIATNRPKQPDLFLTWTCIQDRSRAFRGLITVLKLVAEEKAQWGPWSCWTACKATCWGGLQTRERKCLNGLPSRGPCKGAGSEKRNCYHGTQCPFRVRKDALSLTPKEQKDLIQAMEKYKADTSAKGFFNAACAHGWPKQCDGRSCCRHQKKVDFMSWHRTIILNFEEGLSRHLEDKTLGMPYWNWLRVTDNPPDIVWKKFIEGRPNPFAHMKVRIDEKGQGIERSRNVLQSSLSISRRVWGDVATKYYRPYSVLEFAAALYDAHGQPHLAVCSEREPRCKISMQPVFYAGFDPIFMFHHCQVDRLWAVAQYEVENDGNTTWTTQTAMEPMEPGGNFGKAQMPFGNRTLNPFPIVQAVNNRRDSYYYEELTGVKYDNLESDGFPEDASKARPPGKEALFIAHYLQSVDGNVDITYYENDKGLSCSRLKSTAAPFADTLLLGNTDAYRNTVPRITPVERVHEWELHEDYKITACYDAQLENDQRVRRMPDPFLVYYVPNQAIDIFKYQWESGRKFPTWRVTVHAKTQWVFFFGKRSGKIRQVSSRTEWLECDGTDGRAFPCNRDACLLKLGVYYLIDSSPAECKKGLKFHVISVE